MGDDQAKMDDIRSGQLQPFTHCQWCGAETTGGEKYCPPNVTYCAKAGTWYEERKRNMEKERA